jgi:hypothetical protein
MSSTSPRARLPAEQVTDQALVELGRVREELDRRDLELAELTAFNAEVMAEYGASLATGGGRSTRGDSSGEEDESDDSVEELDFDKLEQQLIAAKQRLKTQKHTAKVDRQQELTARREASDASRGREAELRKRLATDVSDAEMARNSLVRIQAEIDGLATRTQQDLLQDRDLEIKRLGALLEGRGAPMSSSLVKKDQVSALVKKYQVGALREVFLSEKKVTSSKAESVRERLDFEGVRDDHARMVEKLEAAGGELLSLGAAVEAGKAQLESKGTELERAMGQVEELRTLNVKLMKENTRQGAAQQDSPRKSGKGKKGAEAQAELSGKDEGVTAVEAERMVQGVKHELSAAKGKIVELEQRLASDATKPQEDRRDGKLGGRVDSSPGITQQLAETTVMGRVPRKTLKQQYYHHALFDFERQHASQLALTEGDKLLVLSTTTHMAGWWRAQNEAREEGLVPSNFLQLSCEGWEPDLGDVTEQGGASNSAVQEQLLPSGCRVATAHSVRYPDGSVRRGDGSLVLPHGEGTLSPQEAASLVTAMCEDGGEDSVLLPDGSVLLPSGAFRFPSGAVRTHTQTHTHTDTHTHMCVPFHMI